MVIKRTVLYGSGITALSFLVFFPALLINLCQASRFIGGDTLIQDTILDSRNYQDIRNGLPNSYIRFTREKTGTVAFMGGSITQNPGWRDRVCIYLQDRFPETSFEFINGGLSSTGSTPGAFRLQTDVLDRGTPDLLFEEAAVNDRTNMFDSTACLRGMEGIVAHARRTNPFMDIVLLYFVDPDKMNDYNHGKTPYEINAHEQVAIHYNLPSVNLAKEVTDRINNGEFTWEKDFVDLHPSPFGQELYFHSIRTLLEKCWEKMEGQYTYLAYDLPGLIDKFSYTHAGYVDVRQAQAHQGWTLEANWSPSNSLITHRMVAEVPVLFSCRSQSWIDLRFRGTAVGICAVTGPDAGIIEYSIDGEYTGTIDLYTQWSRQYNLPWFVIFEDELPDTSHQLHIKISDRKNPESEGNCCRLVKFLVNCL